MAFITYTKIYFRLNAITRDMYLTLPLLFDEASLDESVKAVVLTGRGKYYSSGNDLSMFKGAMEPGGMKRVNFIYFPFEYCIFHKV